MYLYGVKSASNLGSYLLRGRRGMGDPIDLTVDSTPLYIGLGLLGVAALMFVGEKAGSTAREYGQAIASTRRRRKRRRQLSGGLL